MIIEALERELPPATLLLGPDLEQMFRAAYQAARKHGALIADIFGALPLHAGDARNAVKFAQTAPFGSFKVVIAALDGSTAQAQNILLKVLEDQPLLDHGGPATRFILVSTARPLPTIVSRCQLITVPGDAASPEAAQKVTAQVAAALTAAAAGDLRGLDTALAGWGDVQHAVLEAQLTEAAAGGSRVLTPALARRLLGALGRFSGAHPRLAAHAALISGLGDKEQHA